MAARASKQTPPDEENVWYTATKLDRSDLSPLTRGKPRPSSTRRRALRLISAHTGKTPRLSDRSCHVTAHPRSREENIDAWQLPERHVGSSPLTRGKPSRRKTPTLNTGLIPAHAGKTGYQPHVSTPPSAHPRSRGENARYVSPQASSDGSSPLTRGKRNLCVFGHFSCRLIPAHAGKTAIQSAYKHSCSAHPRSRGENDGSRLALRRIVGSSPLTRGKRKLRSRWSSTSRLIPAHAGKTTRTPPQAMRTAAHPRSRGENENCSVLAVLTPGSSPLTRGKHEPRSPPGCCPGLIPAHAGKTDLALVSIDAREAHPRSRGENMFIAPVP